MRKKVEGDNKLAHWNKLSKAGNFLKWYRACNDSACIPWEYGLSYKGYSDLYPFGIGNDNIDFIFQKIKDRNPVFTCGFHTGILTIIVKKPLLEFENWIIKGGKAFLLVIGFNTTAGFNDCGNKKRWVIRCKLSI